MPQSVSSFWLLLRRLLFSRKEVLALPLEQVQELVQEPLVGNREELVEPQLGQLEVEPQLGQLEVEPQLGQLEVEPQRGQLEVGDDDKGRRQQTNTQKCTGNRFHKFS